MLNQVKPCFAELRNESGYLETELLDTKNIRVYTFESDTEMNGSYNLCSADIDPKRGIEIVTFDQTVIATNELQDQIINLYVHA
jgi:hypothetical protein